MTEAESNDDKSEGSEGKKATRQIQSLEAPQILPQAIPFKYVITTIVLSVLAIVYVSSVKTLFLIVGVIVGLSAIIMMHEASHFIVAKKSGMKCTEFFVGFGPRLWSFFRGETEYGVKSIPAGGYVRIVGMTNIEEVDPADEPRSYRNQNYFKRVSTTLAGIVSHFVLAFILIWCGLVFLGTIDEHLGLKIDSLTHIKGKQTPAEKAGIKIGDTIVSIDGKKPSEWDDIPLSFRSKTNQDVKVVIERNGKTIEKTVVPVTYASLFGKTELSPGERLPKGWNTRGFIGIGPEITYSKYGPIKAIPESARVVQTATVSIVRALGDVFSPTGLDQIRKQVLNEKDANESYRLSSPVGITKTAGEAVDSGIRDTLNLIIVINLSLGIFNLVPLLPFDGGHVAIATYEEIVERFRRRKYRVDIRRIAPVAYAVVGIMAVLTLTSLYLDIAHPPGNPFQ